MIGESETPSVYDEEWENLLDSGILEAFIQKAENENTVKRATQVTQAESLPDCEILEDLVQKAEHESALKKDAVKEQTASETPGSKSILGVKRKQALNCTESRKMQESLGSKLHDALAKVANKLMPSAALLGPS